MTMRVCQATHWVAGRAIGCGRATTSPKSWYCQICRPQIEGKAQAEVFPPLDKKGRETRFCIGEKTTFLLGPEQLRLSVPAEPRILISTPEQHPNWVEFDKTHDGVWTVYVLRFEDGGFYVGHTGKELGTRVEEHRAGKSKLTVDKVVRDVVYSSPVSTRTLAQQLEASVAQLLQKLGFRVLSR